MWAARRVRIPRRLGECRYKEAPGSRIRTFAFPLRTSDRYPGGFDAQTLERRRRLRQMISAMYVLGLWMQLGTS